MKDLGGLAPWLRCLCITAGRPSGGDDIRAPSLLLLKAGDYREASLTH